MCVFHPSESFYLRKRRERVSIKRERERERGREEVESKVCKIAKWEK